MIIIILMPLIGRIEEYLPRNLALVIRDYIKIKKKKDKQSKRLGDRSAAANVRPKLSLGG